MSTDDLKWITVSLTTRRYLDPDGNEVDFVTWLRIHLPDVAKAWGLGKVGDPSPTDFTRS